MKTFKKREYCNIITWKLKSENVCAFVRDSVLGVETLLDRSCGFKCCPSWSSVPSVKVCASLPSVVNFPKVCLNSVLIEANHFKDNDDQKNYLNVSSSSPLTDHGSFLNLSRTPRVGEISVRLT